MGVGRFLQQLGGQPLLQRALDPANGLSSVGSHAFDVPDGYHLDLPGGRRTFVREVQGPPGAPTVMLFHGLGATGGLNWAGSFSALGAHFRVVAVDLRGHGRGGRTSLFRLEDCADDAKATAEALGIQRCIAVGYSMGGPVAMLLWQRHRDLVSGLVLAATSRNFRGHQFEQLGFGALAAVSALGSVPVPPMIPFGLPSATRLLGRVVPTFVPIAWALDELRHHDPATVLHAASAVGNFNARDWVGQIDVPVAVIATTRDRLVPVSRQARLAMDIPSAVLHPVDEQHLRVGLWGHVAMVEEIVDACGEVARRSARWIRNPIGDDVAGVIRIATAPVEPPQLDQAV